MHGIAPSSPLVEPPQQQLEMRVNLYRCLRSRLKRPSNFEDGLYERLLGQRLAGHVGSSTRLLQTSAHRLKVLRPDLVSGDQQVMLLIDDAHTVVVDGQLEHCDQVVRHELRCDWTA